MEAALLAGTNAASLAMLRGGDPASRAARRRAVELIRSAGAPGYDLTSLAGALSGPGRLQETRSARGAADNPDLALAALALQLEVHAREWFLANVVRIGLADGPLTPGELDAVAEVARSLGMTRAQAQDVIWLTDEAAQAG